MSSFIWCEDSASGYQFWKTLFGTLFPDHIVESKKTNSGLRKAVNGISDTENTYYIIMDNAIDNPNVLREMKRLRADTEGKANVRLIKLHSFEFALISFEYLENWIFADDDELKVDRHDLLDARKRFVQLIYNGGNAEELKAFKTNFNFEENLNTENIAAKLLFRLTRNTGFETDKSKIGICFINSCCEWDERQNDDICGLDSTRLTLHEKMTQITEHSALNTAFKEAGL